MKRTYKFITAISPYKKDILLLEEMRQKGYILNFRFDGNMPQWEYDILGIEREKIPEPKWVYSFVKGYNEGDENKI